MRQRPSDLIQSVSRAFRVLEVVGEEPGGLSPKVVARRADLHLSTTYHLLRTLAYEGYLVRTPEGDYRLGLEIADRFRDLCSSLARPPRTVAVLRHLAESTGHSAYLARFVHGRIAIASVVEAPGSPHLEDLVPGFDEGAHATALGKALLATLATGARRELLEETGRRPFTSTTVVEDTRLDRELQQARREGLFVEEGQFRAQVSCAAALVATGDPADPWWAVAVSAASPVFARRRAELAAALRVAAVDLAA